MGHRETMDSLFQLCQLEDWRMQCSMFYTKINVLPTDTENLKSGCRASQFLESSALKFGTENREWLYPEQVKTFFRFRGEFQGGGMTMFLDLTSVSDFKIFECGQNQERAAT